MEAGEKSRTQLDTPRWRATFDLALGRVLALRARAMGYNVMLAEMKTLPRQFQTPGDNTWRIVPASEDHAPPRSQKLAKRARQYLERSDRGAPRHSMAAVRPRGAQMRRWRGTGRNSTSIIRPRPRPAARNGIQLEEDRQREMMRRQRQQQQEHVPVKQ